MNGAVAAIKNERLLFLIPGLGQTASGKSIAPFILARNDGDQHYFNLADRGNYTGVRAKWQDTKNAKPQQLAVQRQHAASDEAENPNYLEGDSNNVFTLPTIYANKESAMRAARAKWVRIQQGSVQFSINLAMGRPELYPETPIKVRGFKEAIDRQNWIINTVVHTLNASGYVTKIDLDALAQRAEFAITEI